MKKVSIFIISLIIFTCFHTTRVEAKELISCNVQRKVVPIIDIESVKKTCTIQKDLKGVTPSELGGGPEAQYLISGKGNIYKSWMNEELPPSCKFSFGKSTLLQNTVFYYSTWIKPDTQDLLAQYLKSFSSKNYLDIYGGIGYQWMMVSPRTFATSADRKLGNTAVSFWHKYRELYPDEKTMYQKAQQYGYREGYIASLGGRAVYTIDDKVYNPWTKQLGANTSQTKNPGYIQVVEYEAKQNLAKAGSRKHQVYRGPRGFLGKDKNGKIIVARQENIRIDYDSNGKPYRESDYGYFHTLYDIKTCTLD